MKKIKYLIEHYGKVRAGVYSSTANTISNATDFDKDLSIEATADTFTIRLPNTNNIHSDDVGTNFIMDVDDRILIYIKSGEAEFDDNDLVMDGIITEVRPELSVDNKELVITGLNRLEKLMNMLWYIDETSMPAWKIIVNLIGHTDDENSTKFFTSSTEAGRQYEWTNNWGNATNTTSINHFREFTPVFTLIEEVSRSDINKDGDYAFWLSPDNKFRWVLKDSTPVSTFAEGTEIINYKAKRGIWDVISAMIIDCGRDAAGSRINTGLYDETSAAEYGLKFAQKKEMINISGPLFDLCRKQTGWTSGSDKWYPDAADYPFTIPWPASHAHTIGGTPYAVGATIIVANDAAFNAEIKAEARYQGKQKIKEILKRTGTARWKIDVQVRGIDWEDATGLNKPAPGYVHNLDIPSLGWTGTNMKPIRLRQVSHDFSNSGWTVDLHFEEDVAE